MDKYYQYEIKITNIVDLKNNPNNAISNKENESKGSEANQSKQNKKKESSAISTHFMINSGRKLLNSIQNDKVQSFTMIVGKTIKYTMLGARALDGDVTAMITIALDLISELVSSAQQVAMQVAAEKNSVDEARYAAGAMSLEGVSVSRSWWSNRYEYDR